jgi:hypothetical protein
VVVEAVVVAEQHTTILGRLLTIPVVAVVVAAPAAMVLRVLVVQVAPRVQQVAVVRILQEVQVPLDQ